MYTKRIQNWIFCVVLLIGLVGSFQNKLYAAEPALTVNVKNRPLKEVFTLIEKQSQYVFIYKSNEVDINRLVTANISNASIDKVLSVLFAASDVNFKVNNLQIILTKKITPAPVPSTTPRQEKKISGTITDVKGEPIIGANIVLKGTTLGIISDVNGNFSISVPDQQSKLLISYIGYNSKEVVVGSNNFLRVTLEEFAAAMNEVVVVGYGTQKKASLVGAIAQTKGDALARAGGVTNLAQSLTGQLPGVTTLSASAQPGNDNPQIFIRGQSTWNGGQPLILVDGVERAMNDVDVSEVESVSVLKDASATAVYGVKGADGVILITTKRGLIGKPQFSVSANRGIKNLSRLPDRLNSYETLKLRNEGVERELTVNPSSWSAYNNPDYIENFNPQNPNRNNLQWMYPDVDWLKTIVKDWAYSERVNASVSGGSDFAKYFGSLSYTHDGDLFNSKYNELYKYDPGYTYDRFNFRSNLDFQLTSTTQFSVNLSGYVGKQKTPLDWQARNIFNSYLRYGGDEMVAVFPDGIYGYNPGNSDMNPYAALNTSGVLVYNRTQISTDFSLIQKLDFITKGLFFKGSLSYDNYFVSNGNNINGGNGNDPTGLQFKRVTTDGVVEYWQKQGTNGYQYIIQPRNTITAENSSASGLEQALVYELSLNYAKKFKKSDIGLLAVFKRRINSTGAVFPNYREDWVGRMTYNYDSRYMGEINAAYNGSEKFGPGYRFGFFPSLALGWMISNETFAKRDWLDKLKVRFSIGKVGNDAGIARWQYISDWDNGGYAATSLSTTTNTSINYPYMIYKEKVIPNVDLHWETAIKRNFGLELAVLNNLISFNFDLFNDNRDGIFMSGAQRKIPTYFGASPIAANIGKTTTKGYEFEIKVNKKLTNGMYLWASMNMTHSKDEVVYREDPELLPDYQKAAGFQIGQTKMRIYDGVMQTWDDVYASVNTNNNIQYRLPGDYTDVDFNGDGLIDQYDAVPVAYPTRPQNSYNYSLGMDYKGWSVMLQFYAVNNVSRSFEKTTFFQGKDVAFDYDVDYWTPQNLDSRYAGIRFNTMEAIRHPYEQLYDGSFVRLKTAELAYTYTLKKGRNLFDINSAKVFVNGNNLLYWSKLPDDREGASTNSADSDNYPLYRLINVGFNITF